MDIIIKYELSVLTFTLHYRGWVIAACVVSTCCVAVAVVGAALDGISALKFQKIRAFSVFCIFIFLFYSIKLI